MNNKKTARLVVALLIAVIATAGYWYVSNRDKQVDNSLVLYGNVDVREINLAFNNSEHIDQLLVQEGDRVHKGQLLASIHKSRLLAESAAAEAGVAAQGAVVARLKSGSRPEEVRQASANLAAARARLVDAQVTFERTSDLFKKKVVARQILDDAKAGLDTARAEVKVAKEVLALATEGPRKEEIEEAIAMLKVSEAQLSLALERLKDTEMYAPADGIIRNRILEPGDMASPQTPVFTLALTDPVWVRTYAQETLLGKLAQGMHAEVSTDSFPGKVYPGWIGFISPTAEFTPKNVETPELRTRLVYQVRVYVCNPQDELRLGMPATVSIALDQAKPVPGSSSPQCGNPAVD